MIVKKKQLTIVVILLGAAFITALFFYYFKSKNNSNVIDSTAASDRPESPAFKSQNTLNALITTDKVPAKFTQMVGPKAFTIARTGDYRPNGNALDYVKSLLDSSKKGNALATFSIYLAVLDCKRAYSTDDLNSFNTMKEAGADKNFLKDSERRLSECSSLVGNNEIMQGEWLGTAAQQGSIEAMILYSIDTNSAIGPSDTFIKNPDKVIEWKTKAMGFLENAASKGSIDAIIRLAGAYENGILAKEDQTTAYAYYLAAQKAYPNSVSSENMKRYQNSLRADQQQAAINRANVIYQSCCAN
ncbi:sel1 repeat family protein [Xanthomonas translucens]|nr:sel1 repeat family protein [Xanthomonas translucens]MCS3361110.1 sel1 repeat family protein [Xanthomonas translucens pv. translucens]MCS3374863.1 sel1 repeat family protein [Xanthomonas translucens pv. translucens]MCT8275852.1 sel1 repeat family protein [Xanthomonas translucens pv. translucens]MCT8279480.1 sel1 repeat family protein [Xanthomonas translucens pv. translucens]MCT8290702.1 sel1 repeat family protein [Xanthomonas translucens pv. translucens]